jgi:hypothetical protein
MHFLVRCLGRKRMTHCERMKHWSSIDTALSQSPRRIIYQAPISALDPSIALQDKSFSPCDARRVTEIEALKQGRQCISITPQLHRIRDRHRGVRRGDVDAYRVTSHQMSNGLRWPSTISYHQGHHREGFPPQASPDCQADGAFRRADLPESRLVMVGWLNRAARGYWPHCAAGDRRTPIAIGSLSCDFGDA